MMNNALSYHCQLRACAEAKLTLVRWRAVPSFMADEIILDAAAGTKSIINYDGEEMASYDGDPVSRSILLVYETGIGILFIITT